jgi:hypothetical protein
LIAIWIRPIRTITAAPSEAATSAKTATAKTATAKAAGAKAAGAISETFAGEKSLGQRGQFSFVQFAVLVRVELHGPGHKLLGVWRSESAETRAAATTVWPASSLGGASRSITIGVIAVPLGIRRSATKPTAKASRASESAFETAPLSELLRPRAAGRIVKRAAAAGGTAL